MCNFGEGCRSWAIPIKKTFFHRKRDNGAREEFKKIIKAIPKEQLVFLDESGIEDNACPSYGWSCKGDRCYEVRVYRHIRREPVARL